MMSRLVALPIVIVLTIPITMGLDVAGASTGPTAPPAVVIDDTVRAQLANAGPNEPITVIVHLREQASFASAEHGTRRQRRRAVVQALRATSDSTQKPLRALLDDPTQSRARAFVPAAVGQQRPDRRPPRRM